MFASHEFFRDRLLVIAVFIWALAMVEGEHQEARRVKVDQGRGQLSGVGIT